MIFYDFEVFEKDWLAVFIDVTKKKEHVIINSPDVEQTIKVFLEKVSEFNAVHMW